MINLEAKSQKPKATKPKQNKKNKKQKTKNKNQNTKPKNKNEKTKIVPRTCLQLNQEPTWHRGARENAEIRKRQNRGKPTEIPLPCTFSQGLPQRQKPLEL